MRKLSEGVGLHECSPTLIAEVGARIHSGAPHAKRPKGPGRTFDLAASFARSIVVGQRSSDAELFGIFSSEFKDLSAAVVNGVKPLLAVDAKAAEMKLG